MEVYGTDQGKDLQEEAHNMMGPGRDMHPGKMVLDR